MIRFATEEDAQALLAIYAYYIDTEITFEYELPTEAEFRKRIRTVLEEYPYLIYEEAGKDCMKSCFGFLQSRESAMHTV